MAIFWICAFFVILACEAYLVHTLFRSDRTTPTEPLIAGIIGLAALAVAAALLVEHFI